MKGGKGASIISKGLGLARETIYRNTNFIIQ